MERKPKPAEAQADYSPENPYIPPEIHVEGMTSVYVPNTDGSPGTRLWVQVAKRQAETSPPTDTAE